MAKIYKYQKVTNAFTTICLAEPDYQLLGLEERITELCTFGDGNTYVSVPDSIVLPEQPAEIVPEEVTMTDELKLNIKSASPHMQLINARVVEKIREVYSVDEELKLLRIAPSEETLAYNEHAEACRAWGRAEKAKLGL